LITNIVNLFLPSPHEGGKQGIPVLRKMLALRLQIIVDLI